MTLGLSIALATALLVGATGVALLIGAVLTLQDQTLPPGPHGRGANPLDVLRGQHPRQVLATCRRNWPRRPTVHNLLYAGLLFVSIAVVLVIGAAWPS